MMQLTHRELADKLEAVYDALNVPKRDTPQTAVYRKAVILEVMDLIHECGIELGKDFDTGQYLP